MSTYAKPFLKWAGGKGQLVPELLKHIPDSWDYTKDPYIEPFVGGGALFFALQPENAIINDVNVQLINAYRVLRADVASLCCILDEWVGRYQDDPEGFFKTIRDLPITTPSSGPVLDAARFIFINKTGFNGLYRVNKQGKCNTPWGHNPDANFYDITRLQQCSELLNKKGVHLLCTEFSNIGPDHHITDALVYIDPPYLPVSKTADFTGYSVGGFTYVNHVQLLNTAINYRKRGAHVIVSLGSGELGDRLVQAYQDCHFKIHLVQARRAINSDAEKRGNVGEYIITS